MSKLKNMVGFSRQWLTGRRSTIATAGAAFRVKTYVIGCRTWRLFMHRYFPERELFFLPRDINENYFRVFWRWQILAAPYAEIFIWGLKAPAFLLDFAASHGVNLVFVEDGFIRSVGLGSSGEPPRSLCVDTRAPYFDARRPSDLEVLLGQYDFASNPALLQTARKMIEQLCASGVGKYNQPASDDVGVLYGSATRRRVLVIGQIEGDASIRFGSEQVQTNEALLRIAVNENPGCQIIYKPHPGLSASKGAGRVASVPDFSGVEVVLAPPCSLASALQGVDHVYTMTSLAGMEALLHGVKVTTLGCPFYSGWGLTDDRQPCRRRRRKLSLLELFAGAYLLYPRYFDPHSGARVSMEDVVADIKKQMSAGSICV